MRWQRNPFAWSAPALAVIVALGGASMVRAQEATPGMIDVRLVEVIVQDVDGNDVGSVTFLEDDVTSFVTVTVEIAGLPDGEHGIHVHETGSCDPAGDEPFASAGGHFNPTGDSHGPPPAIPLPGSPVAATASPVTGTGHAGDLGNISVGADGIGRFVIATDRFTLSPGPASLQDVDGSALVIHADPDDLTTDPSGESGARIACGVVFPSAAGTSVATPVA